MKRRRFSRAKGTSMAIQPSAFGTMFEASEEPKSFDLRDGVAIVEICGPLTHKSEWFWDNYESILERVKHACENATSTVVLKLDSPGGDVSGCFETARAIRAAVDASGKRLVAYADGLAASAAYAIASVADEIALAPTSFVGSVGVIQAITDFTGANARAGVRVEVIASGTKKAIGNLDKAIDDGAIAEVQSQVDSLAGLFFALVAEHRPLTAAKVKALEAGVFHGEHAVTAGLADKVCTFEELIAMVASSSVSASTAPNAAAKEAAMGWKADMQKAAEGGDEEAKKALAALEDDGEKKDEEKKDDDAKGEGDDDGEAKSEDGADDDASAEGDNDGDAKSEGEDDDAKKMKGKKASLTTSTALANTVQKLEAEVETIKKNNEAAERKRLLASRPDFSPKLVAVLAKAPLSTVRDAVKNVERTVKKPAAAAQPDVKPALGAPVDPSKAPKKSAVTESDEEFLDRKMGFAAAKSPGVQRDGNHLVLHPMSSDEARAALKGKV